MMMRFTVSNGSLLPARWLGVFSLCLENLQLSGHAIVRLSCTSKAIKDILTANLTAVDRALARLLVQREVGLASKADPSEQEQHTKVVTYLLRVSQIPPALMQRDSARLFRVQRVPMALAEVLVAAGTRITYEQLVDTVLAKIQGIENWVVAQCKLNKQQGLPTGFSELTETVCSGQEVAEKLQDGVNPKTAVELMLIALNAGSSEGMLSLCHGPLAHHLPPEALLFMYKAAFYMCNDRGYYAEAYEDLATAFLKAIEYNLGELQLSEDVIMSLYQMLIQSIREPGTNPDLVCEFMTYLQQMGSNNERGSDGNPTAAGIYSLMQLAMRRLAGPKHADALKDVLWVLWSGYGCSGLGRRARGRLLQDGIALGLAPSCLDVLILLNEPEMLGPRGRPTSYLGNDDYIDCYQ